MGHGSIICPLSQALAHIVGFNNHAWSRDSIWIEVIT